MKTLLNLLWQHLNGRERPFRNIILRAFQEIENTPILLTQYEQVVNHFNGNRQYVNSHIAQEIKKHYCLCTTGNRQKVSTETRLIKSYSELKS